MGRKQMRNHVQRIISAAIVVAAIGVTTASAFADQPGPGDKQCIAGQQGNRQPAHKGGVCTNP
jgi:hypothetical protein